jgi:predicted ester cyclase
MASVEQNKALMRSYIEETWNKGDLDFVDKNFSSDFVNHGTFPGQPTDCDGVKWVISNIRNAIPGVHFTIEDMIAEGDNAVTKWLAKRTHTGDLMGAKPTGNKISVSARVIDSTKDGKVVEHCANRDDLSHLQQVGLIPPAS